MCLARFPFNNLDTHLSLFSSFPTKALYFSYEILIPEFCPFLISQSVTSSNELSSLKCARMTVQGKQSNTSLSSCTINKSPLLKELTSAVLWPVISWTGFPTDLVLNVCFFPPSKTHVNNVNRGKAKRKNRQCQIHNTSTIASVLTTNWNMKLH